MNRTPVLFLIIALTVVAFALSGCRRGAKDDPMPEAEADQDYYETEAPIEPQIPVCGDWVLVMERPTVTGSFDGDAITQALMEGIRQGGCEAFTSRPSNLPAGARVLQIAPRVQAVGGGGNLSIVATDVSAGQVVVRQQERIASGNGTNEARALGQSLASRLQ